MSEPRSGWTIETLRESLLGLIVANDKRYEQQFEAQKQSVSTALAAAKEASSAALASAKEAVQKAESANERRFESVNEFRNTLADQQRTLVPRGELDALEKAMTFRLDAQDRLLAEQRALTVQYQSEQRSERATLIAGRTGLKDGWGMAAGIAGFVVVLMSLLSLVATYFK